MQGNQKNEVGWVEKSWVHLAFAKVNQNLFYPRNPLTYV